MWTWISQSLLGQLGITTQIRFPKYLRYVKIETHKAWNPG
jgi:hypothetical protein